MQPISAHRARQGVPTGAICVILALVAAFVGYALAVVLLVLP